MPSLKLPGWAQRSFLIDGIPWGPIYTIQSIYNNSRGGKDVTQAILNSMRARAAAPAAASPVPAKG